jgi:6-pyruvoyltetrahydropterin/6-carboxytetrahydropterin synthase
MDENTRPSERRTAASSSARPGLVEITRQVEFNASHRLYNPEFSDEKNWQIYGVCNNPNGHGHNYVLDVTVAGELDPATGMIIDLKLLKDIVDECLIRQVDHKNLNLDVPFLRGCVPTIEILVLKFWEQLEDKIPHGHLCELVLYESRTNYARYRGGREVGHD